MRNNKTITIIALAIAIIGLSIGFAAFASTLNISTSASVNPNNTFSVKFASSASTSDQGLSYSVTPTVAVATSEIGGATAGTPTIVNGNGQSSIGNLSAAFTAPGQSVTYTFYVVNDGTFDAYLTNLVFNNANNHNSFKKCESTGGSSGATQSIVDGICITNNDIRLTMSIGNETNITGTTTLNNHILPKDEYETVTVTIAFTGSQYSDGAFTVSFGSIDLHYRTIDEAVEISTSDTLVDNLIPTTEQLEAAIEMDYLYLYDENGSLGYDSSTHSVQVSDYSNNLLYVWICDSSINAPQFSGLELNKWYYTSDFQNWNEYTANVSPISLSDFNAENIDSFAYVTRVINSFGS